MVSGPTSRPVGRSKKKKTMMTKSPISIYIPDSDGSLVATL